MQLKYIFSIILIASPWSAWAACSTANIKATAPSSRYVFVAGGAEVEDTLTSLVWQRCGIGQVFSDNGTNANFADDSCTGSVTPKNWQQAFSGVSGAWRVPNIKELASLVAAQCSAPALNDAVFPSATTAWQWSSSPDNSSGNAGKAWAVDFQLGKVESRAKNAAQTSVRLVKDK